MDDFKVEKGLSYVLAKPMSELTKKEIEYKRAYCRYIYQTRLEKMTDEERELFRFRNNENGKKFYNGRKQDHNLVLLLKEQLLD